MPPIDDATRPRVAGSVELDPRQRGAGDHLRMVHDHFRHQLETLTRAVEDLQDGGAATSTPYGPGCTGWRRH